MQDPILNTDANAPNCEKTRGPDQQAQAAHTEAPPEIFGYTDYRAFLKDWFDYLRAQDPRFSLRMLSEKSGLSTGYIPTFLSGKLPMSQNAIGKILPFLRIGTAQKEYLKLLRTVAESETVKERFNAFERLLKLRSSRHLKSSEIETYRYMSHWYCVAIREMVALPDFQLDATWIQNRLRYKVNIDEIQAAIKFLMDHRFIAVLPDGKAQVLGDKHLDCLGGLYRLVLANFHTEMLENAKGTFDYAQRKERAMLGHTHAVSPTKMDQVRDILNEAVQKIQKLSEHDGRTHQEVYQCEFACFPLTIKKEDSI